MNKNCIFAILIAVICFLTGCSIMPIESADYVVMVGEDNGFVAARREYVAIYEDDYKKISKHQYEKAVCSSFDYDLVSSEFCSFDVMANSNPIEKWEYKQSYSEITPSFNTERLTNLLKQMNTQDYKGSLEIEVTEFDSYDIVEINAVNDHTILNSQCAIFNNDKILPTECRVDLNSIRKIYKYNKE